jgi:hypothetical protein
VKLRSNRVLLRKSKKISRYTFLLTHRLTIISNFLFVLFLEQENAMMVNNRKVVWIRGDARQLARFVPRKNYSECSL